MRWITSHILIIMMIISSATFAQDDNQLQLANEYYGKGELEKAREIYDELLNDPSIIPLIHNNYLDLLLDLEDYSAANKYLKNAIRYYPANIDYQLDIGNLLYKENKLEKADNYFREFIDVYKQDIFKLRLAAQYFIRVRLSDYAIAAYEAGRRATSNPMLFSLEMANLYRLQNEKDLMVREYLNYATQNPSNVNFIKNTLQNLLTEPEELEKLEETLIEKVQTNPENPIYSELLIWVSLQQQNFYGAFIQARALDIRQQTEGTRSLQIGLMALRNNDYRSATRIFEYVIDRYPQSQNYQMARFYLIESRESQAKNSFPVSEEAIREVIREYKIYDLEFAGDMRSARAKRNRALLHAFYLNEKDSAVILLEQIVSMPRISTRLRSECKLDLGDIYLLKGEPWESTLLYSQVEKTMKETQTGYEAKLKNAKLSYYKGDFQLAQEHLDILKNATTREISNDAMALSILIQDNTGLDTSDVAMQHYAEIDLLLYQNRVAEAIEAIDSMMDTFAGHSLIDELLWLKSDINIKKGDFEAALSYLQQIVEDYGQDVLSDDAFFTMGKIQEEYLGRYDAAMDIYEEFLRKYPGSIFTAEARKRFRTLRGDMNYNEAVN